MKSAFYNKYKELFQVQDQKIPTSKLTLNHRLFIDQPYVPAYTEQYKLNNKLIEMRKDYSNFDNKIQELLGSFKLPKQFEEQGPSKKFTRPLSNRLNNIFSNENPDIIKSSEMQHVFNYRLKEPNTIQQYKSKLISPLINKTQKQRPIKFPKIEHPVKRNDSTGIKQNIYANQASFQENTDKIIETNYKQAMPSKRSYKEALTRRKEYGKKALDRKERLKLLLKDW